MGRLGNDRLLAGKLDGQLGGSVDLAIARGEAGCDELQ